MGSLRMTLPENHELKWGDIVLFEATYAAIRRGEVFTRISIVQDAVPVFHMSTRPNVLVELIQQDVYAEREQFINKAEEGHGSVILVEEIERETGYDLINLAELMFTVQSI